MCAELQAKQNNPYDVTIERVNKNLLYFKEENWKKTAASVNINEYTQKYHAKLSKI
jgi:hypothetical protein